MPQRLRLLIDVGLKVLLIGLLAFGALSGLAQFEGKAFGWRLLTYPLATVVFQSAGSSPASRGRIRTRWTSCSSPRS